MGGEYTAAGSVGRGIDRLPLYKMIVLRRIVGAEFRSSELVKLVYIFIHVGCTIQIYHLKALTDRKEAQKDT
jgi:hypothetical protein